MARLVLYLTLIILYIGSAMAVSDPQVCAAVSHNFMECLKFVRGLSSKPSGRCCNKLHNLNKLAKPKGAPGKICQCIEDMSRQMNVIYSASHINDLPEECGVHLSFPIANNIDCAM